MILSADCFSRRLLYQLKNDTKVRKEIEFLSYRLKKQQYNNHLTLDYQIIYISIKKIYIIINVNFLILKKDLRL